jgi:hypothetical protein
MWLNQRKRSLATGLLAAVGLAVVVWGEFGRTPRIEKQRDGRDHTGAMPVSP